MKKNKWILIIMLFLLPTVVFASSGEDELSLGMALFMEAFVSIHMSVFVLKPLSMMFAKENSNKLFWIMFIVRAIVLLIFDFFITTMIAMVDFFAVFIGAFLVVPISAAITKTPINKRSNQVITTNRISVTPQPLNVKTAAGREITLKCANCGGTLEVNDKFCANCGSPFDGNNVSIALSNNAAVFPNTKVRVLPTNFDPIYRLSEEQMVEEFINKELLKVGVTKDIKLIPSDVLKRKKILNIIFAILILVFISLIFFHFPIWTYIIGIVILFIFYKVTRKYDLTKYLIKQLKARPNEKITNIVMNAKSTLVTDDSKSLFIVSICLAIALPLFIFWQPRILYEQIEDGYAVRYYTFGVTNFTTATIPETYKDEKVVSLRGNTFSNMPFLKEIKLPDTITEIRGQAFKNDSALKTIELPSNLEYLGGGAFYNCSSLEQIVIPDTVTYLGGEAFYNAKSLTSVKLPKNITEIRGNTFENCTSLKSINIPDSVTRIGGHAFYGCSSLSEVTFTKESALKEIGSSAFRRCDNLYNVMLPKNVSVNSRAFKESPTNITYFEDEDYFDY